MSNIQRVFIFNGKFSPSGVDHYLEWQVFNAKGEPVDFNYRGEAGFDGVNLRIASGCQLHDYTVAKDPTEDSVLYQKGYDMGTNQKRRRCPAKQQQKVIDGWMDAWKNKAAA